MVQNQTFSPAAPADLTGSLQQNLGVGRMRRWEEAIGLPSSAAGFFWLALAVLLVCAGMAVLVMTSVQSFQTRRQISALEAQFHATERENAELVWQIAQHTALDSLRQRALALGYEAPTQRHFVTLTAHDAAPPSADPPLSTTPVNWMRQQQIDAAPWQWLTEQINLIRSWW
jgi:hypothetical protein